MHHERNRAEPQELQLHNYYVRDRRMVALDNEEEVHVDNERDVFTLRSKTE